MIKVLNIVLESLALGIGVFILIVISIEIFTPIRSWFNKQKWYVKLLTLFIVGGILYFLKNSK